MQREIFCSSSYLLFLFCLLFLDFAYDIYLKTRLFLIGIHVHFLFVLLFNNVKDLLSAYDMIRVQRNIHEGQVGIL